MYEEFKRGQLEDAPIPNEDHRRIPASAGHLYVKRTTFGIRFYGFNVRSKPFDDCRVRLAFIHAIDRAALIDDVFLGLHGSLGHPASRRGVQSASAPL